MTAADPKPPYFRLQLTSNEPKARGQLRELLNSGAIERQVVIAELKNGDFHAVGLRLPMVALARMLLAGLHTVQHFLDREVESQHKIGLEVGETISVGEIVGFPMKSEMTKNADGLLVPPPGETLISCGVCHCASFYITMPAAGTPGEEAPARWACTKCGNETKLHRVYGAGSRA